MKTKYHLIMVIFPLLFCASLAAQEIQYNDKIDDEALRKKEEEAARKVAPAAPDPYYDAHIKDSWDQAKEKKADKAIEELKKDYGVEKFDKETLEKGPVNKKKPSPDEKKQRVDDPYYEENIKNSWTKGEEEIKQGVLKSIENQVKDKEGEVEEEKPLPKESDDPYYEENIRTSWEKDKKDVLEKADKKLKEEELIKKEEKKK